MLILASLTGIQDFLFAVRESGGGQAAALRHRSFRIQLVAECLALRLLEAGGLPHEALLYCTGAKAAIDAEGISPARRAALLTAVSEAVQWVAQDSGGRLGVAVGWDEGSGSFSARYARAAAALRRNRLRAGLSADSLAEWPAASPLILPPFDETTEAERDRDRGRRLTRSRRLVVRQPGGAAAGAADEEIMGLRVTLGEHDPARGGEVLLMADLDGGAREPGSPGALSPRARPLARHVPREPDGSPVEFEQLARRSTGAAMLGVVKADVDALGAMLEARLAADPTPRALREFSAALESFFARDLENEKQRPGSPWDAVYTVYAGGDDMLVVGPWDLALDFAALAASLLARRFGPASGGRAPLGAPLTLSAGVAVVKPRHPIRLAAAEADELLDAAKSAPAAGAAAPKDQCAALGGVWKWADATAVLGAGRQVADWIKTGAVQRGWIQTALHLALVRRGEAATADESPPGLASARLAHHVARIWPRPGAGSEAPRLARAWADGVLADFDADPAHAAPHVRHLPAVLRYALLATRPSTSEDNA